MEEHSYFHHFRKFLSLAQPKYLWENMNALSENTQALCGSVLYRRRKIIGHTGWLGQLTELTLEHKTVTRSIFAIENGKMFAWFFKLLNGLGIY